MLDGGCFVTAPDALHFDIRGNWHEAVVIDADRGAEMISQYFVQVHPGRSPVRVFPESDVVIYVIRGSGLLDIPGHGFELVPQTSAYVKPGEPFRVSNPNDDPIELLIGVCPQCSDPQWLSEIPQGHDHVHPQRTVTLSETDRQSTGDRYFRLLVDKRVGSRQVTMFIGSIPRSKAPEHFHLYEEAIVVLSGEGRIWTGRSNAEIGEGSMIFLPRKQPHCIECTVDEGIELAGMFYPAGSPAVSYDMETGPA